MTSSLGKRLNTVELAESFYQGVVDHFEAAGVALPTRQYIAAGDPNQVAWDCEQFVVSLGGIGWGPAPDVNVLSPQLNAQASAVSLRHIVITFQIVRCTPGPGARGQAPDPAAIHANGIQSFRDAGLLSQALVTACTRVRTVLGVPANSGLVQSGAVDPAGPEGQYVGVTSTVAITAAELM